MKFVDQIAKFILEKGIEAKHLTVILPSERAIKYISAALFKANGGPLLAPEFISIDRWVRKNTSQKIVDKTRLLVMLYRIQQKHPLNSELLSFEDFMAWGQTLLNDFDEIDRYLLDSKVVFKNLASIKELEHWSVEVDQLSETQKRFMEFWEKLPEYYQLLNDELKSNNSCYIGKAYRNLSENLNVLFQKDKEHHFIFAGFNALSASEMAIMKQLHKYGKASILFDADKFYLDEPLHEAGLFLRNVIKELEIKEPQIVGNTLQTGTKKIEITECAQQTGQVKVAADLLSRLSMSEMDETLVLLADESLVVPFIKNIPANVGKANISLGLPFRNTAMKTWIELIFTIQENQLRYKTKAIYHNDLRIFFNHTFVDLITTEKERSTIVKLEQEAVRKNRVFRNVQSIQISDNIDPLLHLITTPWNQDWVSALQQLRDALQYILARIPGDDEFNLSLIETFLATIQEFNNIVLEQLPEMTIRSFKLLFQQHWFNKSIAYHGNPIKGLQIMGLLESRLLDFKNLIIVGFNEGNLPPTNPINTFIPMDLRNYLKLPTPREKQGLFAHHFYRLLHHAENIWASYSTARENIGSNEESRYVLQLEYELAKANSAITFERKVYVVDKNINELSNSTEVDKTPALLKKLEEKLASSTSISMLNKYLACPLDFFYRYIAELGETKEIEEQMESNTMGTIIHKTLENLYEPFARHTRDGTPKNPAPPALTSYDIDQFLMHYDTELRKNFALEFDNDPQSFATGKNLLVLEVAIEMLRKFLKAEKKWLEQQTEPVFIEYLELEILQHLELPIAGRAKSFRFKGVIDRVDSVGGKYRIIDYKTSPIKKENIVLKLNDDPEVMLKALKNSKSKHGLQLAMYTYLFKQKLGFLPSEVGIISLINLKEGLFNFADQANTLEEYAEHLPKMIQAIGEEMFDENLLLEHDPDARYCLYCENKKPEKNF